MNKLVAISIVFIVQLLIGSHSYAVGLGTAYNASEYALTLGPNEPEAMFVTDPVYGVAFKKNRNTVRIVAVGKTYLGADSHFRLALDEYEVDYIKQYIQIDIRKNGTVTGYTKIYGYIDEGDDGIILEGEVPDSVGKPKGLLFSGKYTGFDENISLGDNYVAAETRDFGGWAAQFGTVEPLHLIFRDMFDNAKDWPGLSWFFENNNRRHRSYTHKYVDLADQNNNFNDRYGLRHDSQVFLFKATAIQVVPIPASLALLASGFVALMTVGRRRRVVV